MATKNKSTKRLPHNDSMAKLIGTTADALTKLITIGTSTIAALSIGCNHSASSF